MNVRQRCTYKVESDVECPLGSALSFGPVRSGPVDVAAASEAGLTLRVALSDVLERAVVTTQSPMYMVGKVFGYLGSALALHVLVRFMFETVATSRTLRALVLAALMPPAVLLSEVRRADDMTRLGLRLGFVLAVHVLGAACVLIYAVRPYSQWLDTFGYFDTRENLLLPLVGMFCMTMALVLQLSVFRRFVSRRAPVSVDFTRKDETGADADGGMTLDELVAGPRYPAAALAGSDAAPWRQCGIGLVLGLLLPVVCVAYLLRRREQLLVLPRSLERGVFAGHVLHIGAVTAIAILLTPDLLPQLYPVRLLTSHGPTLAGLVLLLLILFALAWFDAENASSGAWWSFVLGAAGGTVLPGLWPSIAACLPSTTRRHIAGALAGSCTSVTAVILWAQWANPFPFPFASLVSGAAVVYGLGPLIVFPLDKGSSVSCSRWILAILSFPCPYLSFAILSSGISVLCGSLLFLGGITALLGYVANEELRNIIYSWFGSRWMDYARVAVFVGALGLCAAILAWISWARTLPAEQPQSPSEAPDNQAVASPRQLTETSVLLGER